MGNDDSSVKLPGGNIRLLVCLIPREQFEWKMVFIQNSSETDFPMYSLRKRDELLVLKHLRIFFPCSATQ